MERSFAGFIITYERPTILENTLNIVFKQTVSPKKIVIIDNSKSNETEELIYKLNNPKVFYHKVGYNSGPAGGAAIGLKILSEEGFEWIYWGDDDDPPYFDDTFEILLNITKLNSYCGCVGSVGQFFNKKTGFIKRVPDNLLEGKDFLEVDTIAGGMSKIVNGKMIQKFKILPEEKLFFSFEDLDLDIKIKKIGYKLIVDKKHFLKHRLKFNRINLRKKKIKNKSKNELKREYYSVRNVLYIFQKNKFYFPFIIFINYTILKQFLRFKYGFNNAYLGFKITFIAIYDYLRGNMGLKKN